MFLSRLLLNPRSRRVQGDLADCHELHRTIMSAFPAVGGPSARQELGVLYRVESTRPGTPLVLLVQSKVEPNWIRLPASYVQGHAATKRIDAAYQAIEAGAVLRFRLRANPTRLIRPDARKHGQRVDLRREADKVAWLERQGERGGFRLGPGPAESSVSVRPAETLMGHRKSNGTGSTRETARLTVAASLFEGVLEVTDASAFGQALAKGVGRGKAYGCGLLSVAPIGRVL